jgi:MoxR-like ATPase
VNYGEATKAKIAEIVEACGAYGGDSIILLSGVAGTGKTFIALAAAQEHAGDPLLVEQVQFHQTYSYEDFIEGLAPMEGGGFERRDGIFYRWNQQARNDPDNRYVLLIEELSRANLGSVLGELMTYVEHRDREFRLPISQRPMRVAENLTILGTMNPRDRSALEIDDAWIRRVRLIPCPPDTDQLKEMLEASLEGHGAGEGEVEIVDTLVNLFEECRKRHPDSYEEMMPFGHGMFAGVTDSNELAQLWRYRIRWLLRRPLSLPHPFAEDVEELYPWQ